MPDDVAAVLAACADAGVTLRVEGGRLLASPKRVIADRPDLAEAVRANKAAILAALARPVERTPDAPEPEQDGARIDMIAATIAEVLRLAERSGWPEVAVLDRDTGQAIRSGQGEDDWRALVAEASLARLKMTRDALNDWWWAGGNAA